MLRFLHSFGRQRVTAGENRANLDLLTVISCPEAEDRLRRPMRALLAEIMESATVAGADYADARHVRSRVERIALRQGRVDEVLESDEEGIGVRVRVGGAWGFAGTRGHRRRDGE